MSTYTSPCPRAKKKKKILAGKELVMFPIADNLEEQEFGLQDMSAIQM